MQTNAWVTKTWPLRFVRGVVALAGLLVCLAAPPLASAVPPIPPAAAPVLTGSGVQGTAHTCSFDRNAWTPAPPDITFMVRWQAPGNDFYLPPDPDAFSTFYGDPPDGPGNVTCTVYGIVDGEAWVPSLTSNAIPYSAAPPPAVPAQITGSVAVSGPSPIGGVGDELTCQIPPHIGDEPIAVSYLWLGVGLTTSTFTPTTANAGVAVRCQVTLSNDAGSDSGLSPFVGISGIAINMVLPSILLPGASEFPLSKKKRALEDRLAKTSAFKPLVNRLSTIQEGESLTCQDGVWDLQGASIDTFDYTWQRDGAPVSGANGKTYSPSQDGSYRCSVAATNLRGTSSFAQSAPVDIALPAAQTPSTPPPAGQTTTTTTSTTPRETVDDDDGEKVTPQESAAVVAAATDDSGPFSEDPPAEEPVADDEDEEQTAAAAKKPDDPDALQPGQVESPYGPTNDERSDMATHIPTPGDLNLSPKKIATGSMLALIMVALLGLPAAVFNETAERHHDVFAGWLAGFTAFSGKLFGWIPTPKTPGKTLALSVFIGAVIFSFVSPGFPTAPGSWEYFAGMMLGLALVGGVFFSTWRWYINRFIPEATGEWRIYPLFIGLATMIVIVSRIANFVPGVIMGTIAEYEPTKHLGRVHEGRRVAVTFGAMLTLALVCWILWIPVQAHATDVGAGDGWLILDAALSVGFISGLETTVFGLLPLKFLDGYDLRRWNAWVWAGMWGLGVLWFSIVIVDPAVSGYGTHTDSELPVLAILLGTLIAIATLTWIYFFQRHKRDPSLTENH